MFDTNALNNMPKFDTFNYWFIRKSATSFDYGLRSTFTGEAPVIEGTFNSDEWMNYPKEVQDDFKQFTNRPEFCVGDKVILNTAGATSNNQETMINAFETLIVGAIFIRALRSKHDPDRAFSIATRFLDWIRSTDFYSCPGSTRFHDAEPSGLLFHTLNVYNNMVELRKINKFSEVDYTSIAIVSLCHDLTKIGNYESYTRNVKNEHTGEWEKVPSYKWKCNPFPFGHGVASMYIVTQFFQLSLDEMLGIRWHMGEYRVAAQEVGELEDASETYPIVRMVQFADQLACAKY